MALRSIRTLLLVLPLAFAWGCGDDDGAPDGAADSAVDAPARDEGAADSGSEDAASDQGASDEGVADGGAADDGVEDAGQPDMDTSDGGSPDVCGGLLGGRCAATEFCLFGMTCGFLDDPGTCTPIPEGCPRIVDPVCGCDGMTYTNECLANREGVSVQSRGECARACGTAGAPPCASGEYCDFPLAAACGAADAPGQCIPVPEACPDVLAPVCGCDDQTYDNDCLAAQAGVSVAAGGRCEDL